ncbi:hypothetical protein CEY16_03465 [Halalkalibacillus sediminis]|uniref:Cell wall elongation regulator TseB-like domain-containing protein n=1 Tax=Halalkalibacillus sediminis TaxID=2018042 RepID=A0A2I0QWY2_9BACI|nr:DUF5590 domain-containing protein [Halalkalibacillus sediminis]PKR78824.1 hypothetical protein CEY16_03465 [Halalkalibacillus sediminis]
MFNSIFTVRNLIYSIVAFLIILVIATISIFIFIFNDVQGEAQTQGDEAIEVALKETPLTEASDTRTFNAEHSYVTVFGEDESDNGLIVFVPIEEEADSTIDWVEQSNGLTEKEMLDEWRESCSDCDLKQIVPGKMNEQFVWEIIYTNQSRYYFQTFKFETGELYDSISFSKN